MRLLNTKTLQMRDYPNRAPQYAILSHTWESEEVTYDDLMTNTHWRKPGWSKIYNCCHVAKEDGWEWVWIDTCCIDKSSSAELSEAINAMFRWYRDAAVCYAYLSDHPYSRTPETLECDPIALNESRWFTRGWTLQELLAPKYLLFLDQRWQEIGTKSSLSQSIQEATGISATDVANIRACSVAKRLSWAAKRYTTRVEDEAYCLLGLFDINMPLLYGEGDNAYPRLQIEIINSSTDQSILAWNWGAPDSLSSPVLASSPELFYGKRDVVPTEHTSSHSAFPAIFSMTNKGLTLDVRLYEPKKSQDRNIFVAELQCSLSTNGKSIGVQLMPQGHPNQATFTRCVERDIQLDDESRLSLLGKCKWTRITIQDPPKDGSNEGMRTIHSRETVRVGFKHSQSIAIASVWRYVDPLSHPDGWTREGVRVSLAHCRVGPVDTVTLVVFTASHNNGEGPPVYYIASLPCLEVHRRGRVSLDVFRQDSGLPEPGLAVRALQQSMDRGLPCDYVTMKQDESKDSALIRVRLKAGDTRPLSFSTMMMLHIDLISAPQGYTKILASQSEEEDGSIISKRRESSDFGSLPQPTENTSKPSATKLLVNLAFWVFLAFLVPVLGLTMLLLHGACSLALFLFNGML